MPFSKGKGKPPANQPPTAVLTITPETVAVGADIEVDLTQSYDAEDGPCAGMDVQILGLPMQKVRISFGAPSGTKPVNIVGRVRDTQGKTGESSRQVPVTEAPPPVEDLTAVFEEPAPDAIITGQVLVRVRTSVAVPAVDVLLTNAGLPEEVVVGYSMLATDDPLVWTYDLHVGLQESKPYDLVAQVDGVHMATIPVVVNNLPPPPNDTPPTITVEPEDVVIEAGHAATLVVEATGSEPLAYQWHDEAGPMPGQTSALLVTPPLADGASFFCVVSNAFGEAESRHAMVTVMSADTDAPPAITSSPSSVTIDAGQTVTLTVVATGTQPLRYQWKQAMVPIPDAIASTYVSAALSVSTSFTCEVVNDFGTVETPAAVITVVPVVPVAGVLTKADINWIGCNLMPSDLLMDFSYGGCAGQRVGSDVFIYCSGNEVNLRSPIYKVKLPAASGPLPESAPRATLVAHYDAPYLGVDGQSKRGTWMAATGAQATIAALETEERTLRTSRDAALGNPKLPGRIKQAILQHSQQRVAGMARVRQALRKFLATTKSASATAMNWFEFPANMAVNGGMFWHEGKQLLYVTFGDTYNVAGRGDWGVVAIKFHANGTTTCYGPWRFAGTRADGVTKYGPHVGSYIQMAPDGSMAISTMIGSGNINFPWGSSLWSGCPFPDENTPTGPDAPDLHFPKRHLYYPYIGDKINTQGMCAGPVMSFHRHVDHVIFEPIEGMTQNSVNVAHYGYSSWNEQDQCSGFAYLQVADRAGWAFTGSWAGSPIQDPTNCAAAHAWYSGGLYLSCFHGCPPIVDGITGPTTRAAFSSLHVMDPQRMITNAAGTTVDWQTEAAWQRNMNTDFPAMPTAPPSVVGMSRSFNAGFYDTESKRWICISHGADTWTHWGARTALLQVLKVGP